MHGSPHYKVGTSAEAMEWVNNDYSDGEKLLDMIHKFKPTVRLLLSLSLLSIVM